METKKRQPGETGKGRRGSGAVEAKKRETGFVSEVRQFVEEFGEGGFSPEDVRWEYAALLRKARPNGRRYARELRAARAAYDKALARPFTPFPEGEYGGLRFEFGGIQLPDGTAVDVEVSDSLGRVIAVVTGRANEADGFDADEARTVNEYLRLAGARVA